MRLSSRWMVLLDDRILEFLREEGAHPPSQIARDERIRYGEKHVGNRCLELAQHDFLENLGNGVYQITDRGKEYLDGEYNAAAIAAR